VNPLKEVVQQVVRLLVIHEYDKLVKMSGGIQLSASEMAAAISDYGSTLVYPPAVAFDSIDAVGVLSSKPPKWSIVFPLWTEEEGRSDLTLELTVIEEPVGLRVEIDNLHVL
jgi:hypothetical protein